MIYPTIIALIIEALLFFLSYIAVQTLGGHAGMVVAIALHLPTSILGIIVGENIKLDISQEVFFFLVCASTIILHLSLLVVFFHHIQKKRE